MNDPQYSYGLPRRMIWSMHITVGIIFILLASLYLGYQDSNEPEILTKIGEATAIIIIILGPLMILYHSHLWFLFKR